MKHQPLNIMNDVLPSCEKANKKRAHKNKGANFSAFFFLIE